MQTILLISPYWKEPHRWMVSSVKLAELWQRMGYRVVVACMGKTDTSGKPPAAGYEDISPTLRIYRKPDVFLPDPLNFGIALGFTGMVRRIIRNEKPDRIIVNKVLFWTSFATIPLTLTGHRITLLTDALVGMTWWPRTLLPKIIMGIGAWTMGWLVLLSAKTIVFFHPQPHPLLRKLGIAHKSRVIPTGIDPTPFGVGARDRARDTVVVSYIGRLESVKGVDDFLAAVVSLKSNPHPNPIPVPFEARVVGWYKDHHPLVEKFQRDVTFTGLSNDIPGELSRTHIFVLPSYSEGLSNALMEAMASGCACIASDVGGNRYLLQNGVSGFLFPAGDREALTAHIRRLLDDPAKRMSMGEAARKRIDEQFSWAVVEKLYKALFDQESSAA